MRDQQANGGTDEDETHSALTRSFSRACGFSPGFGPTLRLNQSFAAGLCGIENRLHWVRDVTFGEDRAPVRTQGLPQVMAALRNTAIGLLRLRGEENMAAACRRYAARPALAFAALGLCAGE